MRMSQWRVHYKRRSKGFGSIGTDGEVGGGNRGLGFAMRKCEMRTASVLVAIT
jgi:hypothetical protein